MIGSKMEVNEILSFEDLKELLDISSNKLTRLTKQGLPFVSLGGETKIFVRSSVIRWLKSLEQQTKELAQTNR